MNVDDIAINFNESSLTLLKIVIGTILLGVALDTRLEDFAAAVRRPVTITIGVVAQFVLLPALTFGLTLLLDVRASVALGMILVACCPPGNVSNILTHRAGGDVALSVSMTAISNVLAIVLMPLNLAFWGGLHPTGKAKLEAIELSALDMLLEIGLVIGVPFVVGITVARLWPGFARTAHRVVGPVSFLGLTAIIVAGVAGNWAIFTGYITVVLVAVFLHDAVALGLGYLIGRVTRLPDGSVRATTFEVGIRNAGLGLLLVFTYFDGLGGMALVAAWWGIWDIIAGLAVAIAWRRLRPVPTAAPAAEGGVVSASLTIAVTGGSGFLGSSVVAALAGAGHRVVSLDVRPGAAAETGSEHPVEERILDVTDRGQVDRVIGEVAPDVVVHLAAIVTPGRNPDRAREYAVDVGGSENVVAACLTHGVRRLVVASSGAAYGYHRDAGASHSPEVDGVPPGWLSEDDPLRGNPEFAYSHHKRLVEELLARTRATHPELEQVILRIGTILGERVDNQITALFERPRLLRIAGSESPFVFIWDADVAATVVKAAEGPATGAFNVAGDGAVTIAEIAEQLGKPVLNVPEPLLRTALRVGRWLRLTPYGPEQTRFLQFRPVLWNARLIEVLGHRPEKTSLEAFRAWADARGLLED